MTTYPWGPHGSQSSPHQVTPNPTQSYVPPPPIPVYNPVVSGGGGGYTGGYSGGGAVGGAVGYSGPPRKIYVMAVILPGIFGPFGLLYANAKAAKILLLLVAANVGLHVMSAPAADVIRANGIMSFIGDNNALASVWSLATVCSVVLSVLGVRSFRAKAAKD